LYWQYIHNYSFSPKADRTGRGPTFDHIKKFMHFNDQIKGDQP